MGNADRDPGRVMAASLYGAHFQGKSLVSAASSFLPALSLLHRIQSHHVDKLLPSLKPASRPVFLRRSGTRALHAHALWLTNEGAAGTDSATSRGTAPMNSSLGSTRRRAQDRQVRARLSRFSQLVAQLRGTHQ